MPKAPTAPPIRQNFPETWIWAEPNFWLRELGNNEMGRWETLDFESKLGN
jgi:hypothetical protein